MGKENKQKFGRQNLWRALTGCTMAVLLAVFGLVTGVILPLSADTEPESELVSHLGQWIDYDWGSSSMYPKQGDCVWKYKGDCYFSRDNEQYKLNQITNRWEYYSGWGSNNFNGGSIWEYKGDYYHSYFMPYQYKLNQTTGKWEHYDWLESYAPMYGDYIWQCNGDYYYSCYDNQYKLDQTSMKWEDYATCWGSKYPESGKYIWKYDGDCYYSNGSAQYKLNQTSMKWEDYTAWGKEFYAGNVWEYKGDYYYSANSTQYKLNQTTKQWEDYIGWECNEFTGGKIWEYNGDYYHSSGSKQYILHQAHTAGESEITTLATCKTAGERTCVCAECGDTYTEEIPVDPNAHDWDDGVETACTCSDDGNILYTCKICGQTRSEVINATGHDDVDTLEWTVTQEATCVAHGRRDKLCTKCGASLAHEETELAEHIWGGYEITQKPTTEEPGEKARHCTVCGTIDEDSRTVVPKLEPKKNSAVWIVIGVAAAAVGGLGVMLAFLIKRSRQKVDVEFTKKV